MSIGNSRASLSPAPSSGGVPVGGNIIPTVPATISEFNGTPGKTFIVKIPGRGVAVAAALWRFTFSVMVSGSMTIDKIVVAKCALDSTTVISFTPVTIAGMSAPFILPVGTYTVDSIDVAMDGEHDYYVEFYFDPGTANPNIGNTGSGDWIFYLYNVGGTQAASIIESFLSTYIYPTSGNGDATALNPVPILTSTALGPHNIIEQVVSAV